MYSAPAVVATLQVKPHTLVAALVLQPVAIQSAAVTAPQASQQYFLHWAVVAALVVVQSFPGWALASAHLEASMQHSLRKAMCQAALQQEGQLVF
jgi:hypothetical protein